MAAIDVAQRYVNAWNARDSAAIVGTFVEGGTYSDPVSGGAISGPHLAGYTDALFAAFPDLHFDAVSMNEIGSNQVALQWLMRGTNSGPFHGGPPTGGSVALPGADFIEVEGDKVRSVQGYLEGVSEVWFSPLRRGELEGGQSTPPDLPLVRGGILDTGSKKWAAARF